MTDYCGLTERQYNVAKLLAEGITGKEAAHKLGLSPKTVEIHRAAIMKKLKIHSPVLLTHFAIANGIVELRTDIGT